MTAQGFFAMLEEHLRLNPKAKDQPLHVQQGGEVSGIGVGSGKLQVCHDCYVTKDYDSTWEYFSSIFTLAGIKVKKSYELANNYWPDSYLLLRAQSPWWLVETEKYGLIRIGWRKRVISISWDFPLESEVTEDDVTKKVGLVHAWTAAKAIEYMTQFKVLAEAKLQEDTIEKSA